MVLLKEVSAVQIKHVCLSCGKIMEVHEHSSWLDIKQCDRNRRALCQSCDSWPGSPSRSRDAGQENHHE
jgi:hypothetical protein